MAEMRTVQEVYIEGSRWPPGDYNAHSRNSLAYDQNWQREHTDDPVGEHDSLRIAYAGGFVVFAGGTTYDWTQTSHVSTVTRLAAGEVEIKLDFAFRAPGKWSVIVWNETTEPSLGEVAVELDTGKLTDTVRVRLSGSADNDFSFMAFGVK